MQGDDFVFGFTYTQYLKSVDNKKSGENNYRILLLDSSKMTKLCKNNN